MRSVGVIKLSSAAVGTILETASAHEIPRGVNNPFAETRIFPFESTLVPSIKVWSPFIPVIVS